MAEKTRTEIKTAITTYITANGAFGITPEVLHDILTDIADSFLQEDDTSKDLEANSVDVGTSGYGVSGVKVIGEQEDAIDDAVISHASGESYDQTLINGYLDDLGEKINEVITALRNHGLIETAT